MTALSALTDLPTPANSDYVVAYRDSAFYRLGLYNLAYRNPVSGAFQSSQGPGFALDSDAGCYFGGAAYYSGAYRNLVAGQGGWAIRNTGGAFTILTGSNPGAAGTVIGDMGERVRVTNTGAFGLNTNNPLEVFHAYASGWSVARIENSSGFCKLGVWSGVGDTFLDASTPGKNLIFSLSGTQRMRLDGSSGNIISQGTAGALLSLSGDTTSGAYQGIAVRNNYGNSSRGAVAYRDTINENGTIVATENVVLNPDGSCANQWMLSASGSRTTDRRVLKASLDVNGFYAGSDNSQSLGWGGNRWSVVYAATGMINTSDETEKVWRGAPTDEELAAAREIIDELGFFQWKQAIDEKGEDARIHFGVRAQQVWRIMAAHNLVDPISDDAKPGKTPYAFLCWDGWEEQVEDVYEYQDVTVTRKVPTKVGTGLVDAEGKPVMRDDEVDREYTVRQFLPNGEKKLVRAAGHRYGVRADQLTLFLIAAQEARLKKLEAGFKA